MSTAESTPESPLKPRQPPLNEGYGSNPPPGPPAYVPYQHYQPSHPVLQSTHVEYRHSPLRRFFEAFVVAVGICALVSMLSTSIAWVSEDSHRHGRVSHAFITFKQWYKLMYSGHRSDFRMMMMMMQEAQGDQVYQMGRLRIASVRDGNQLHHPCMQDIL